MRQRNSLASDRVLVRATAKEYAQIYLVDVVFNTEEGTSPLNHSPMATASASLSASMFRDENVFFSKCHVWKKAATCYKYLFVMCCLRVAQEKEMEFLSEKGPPSPVES